MKNTAFRYWSGLTRARRPDYWPVLLVLVSWLLFSPNRLQAQAMVTTIGGGATSKPYSGYINGDTLTEAMFAKPAGLAIDNSGTLLFVADYTNNAIRLVSAAGDISSSVTTTFASTGITRPLGVAVDGNTNVFVVNYGTGDNGSILRIAGAGGTAGTSKTLASGLSSATAIALDTAGNCYATVNGNKVICITSNGTVRTVGALSTSGTLLQGIALEASGLLALSDAGNNGIWTMNPTNGATTELAGFSGAGDELGTGTAAAFRTPASVAAAGGNMLVVADYGNHKVKLVDGSGKVTLLYGINSNLWTTGFGYFPGWYDGFGSTTNGSAESRLPYGVVVSSDGSVFASEDYYHVLRHVTDTGLTPPTRSGGGSGGGSSSPTFDDPDGVAYDDLGNYLYVANPPANTVQQINLNLATNATSTVLTSANSLTNPVSVLVDSDEHLYVLNQATATNGYVLEFDENNNAYGPIITGLNQPTAFTMDGNGNILVAEQGGRILGFGPNVSGTIAMVTNANVSLQGIALFDDGTIAVSDAGNAVIWAVNSLTKSFSRLTGQLDTNGAAVGTTNFAKLYAPHQLARVAGNRLIVADSNNNRLALVQRNGTISTNIFHSASATIWFGNVYDPVTATNSDFVPMVSPMGVAMGVAGTVFASESHYSDIRQLSVSSLAPATTNPVIPVATYPAPAGIALNSEATRLFIANPMDNTVSVLNLADNQTAIFRTSAQGLNNPVDVVLDDYDDLYVLNQGSGSTDGYILEYDVYGNLLATNASGLLLPTALGQDSSGNLFVAEQNGLVTRISPVGVQTTIATLSTANVLLHGIAIFDDGTIVISDSGNDVIWQIDPVTGGVSLFTGQYRSPGTNFGSASFARLNQPHQIKLAANNLLLAADSGNNRLVVVNRAGAVTSALVSTNGLEWFGSPTDPVAPGSSHFVPMVSPVGVAIGVSGDVFASETYFNDIREISQTGLSQPTPGSNGETGTNLVVTPPVISPGSGYYPMGRTVVVESPVPAVYYTTDGSTPTTNSQAVAISGNIGYIHWFNPTNDLTALKVVAALDGTNLSTVVSGQRVSSADIGVPTDLNSNICAGVGASIVVPIVCDLPSGQQIESYQFRLEIAPVNNSNTPSLYPLSIVPTNDFVPLVTAAQSGYLASNTVTSYSYGVTNGLVIYAIGTGAHVLFKDFAVVALLEVHIPYGANIGDTYSLQVIYPSATADAYHTPVTLTPLSAMTILVTNIPYLVGDSASAFGSWYNAGTFGDGNLDNSDVNQAFFAASGLRVPYFFSDVFDAMDAYPPDSAGFVGGDGQIRYLDWMTILDRSLRIDPSDWMREWQAGTLIDYSTNLVSAVAKTRAEPKVGSDASWPWYRQVLMGLDSVGNMETNTTVAVPVYALVSDGASLSGLQFRAVVTPQNGAPALVAAPTFVAAGGVASPMFSQSFSANQAAFGWSLGSVSYGEDSSNFLGWVTFRVPTNAMTGQTYLVSLQDADGAPNLTRQYDFETRSATVAVNSDAPAATICSDEWKVYFFGSATNAAAADNADPDGDGVPNWMEFLAGTDPPQASSKLTLGGAVGQGEVQLSWLTAPGRLYSVQWSGSLNGGAWTNLTNVSGSGYATNCPDQSPGSSTRFYRLQVLPW